MLSTKTALVTGGAIRIGRAIVLALQSAGFRVIVHYRTNPAQAESLSEWTLHADLSDPAQCATLIKRATAEFGPIDCLVNNASVFQKEALAETSSEKLHANFQVNAFAPIELTRQFAIQAPDHANVINLLDQRVAGTDTSALPYLLSKKTLAEFTKLAALELAPRIRVNAIAPGPVLAPDRASPNYIYDAAGEIPLQKTPALQELTDALLFLLNAPSVTGQTLFIDGGQHLCH